MSAKKPLSILLLSLSSFVQADTILGIDVGAYYWAYDMKGSVGTSIGTDNQLPIDFSSNNNAVLYVALEHPVPFVPNVKIQHNPIDVTSEIIAFDNSLPDSQSVRVAGEVDLTHTELMVYYELLDNWVNLDFGLDIKYFDGSSRFYYPGVVDDKSILEEWVPMLYGKARFDLPLTGLSIAASAKALSFDSNDVTDVDVAIHYEFDMGLGANIGYRALDVDIDNTNRFDSDLKTEGFYLGVNYHF